jgi:uncharacterized membrane protein
MLIGTALIGASSLGYFDFENLPLFVIEKLPAVRFEALWLASLRVHVASACLAFPLCLVSMSRRLQRRPSLHRVLGRATGIIVLSALVPSGVVLSFEAKGGLPVTLGFVLSAAIVAIAMLRGVSAARARSFAAHRRAMHHVVAQMSVAVSSRVMIVGLDAAGVGPDFAYLVALWIPVLGSALVAELVSARSPGFLRLFVNPFERIPRDVPSLPVLVRLRALFRPIPRLER